MCSRKIGNIAGVGFGGGGDYCVELKQEEPIITGRISSNFGFMGKNKNDYQTYWVF